jgi:hypothetical protein
MRETTKLLAEQLPTGLAELVESYILPCRGFDAAQTGHWELVSSCPDRDIELEHLLDGAARNCNIPMIKMLFSKGAKSRFKCLSGAVSGGHVALADMIIDPLSFGDTFGIVAPEMVSGCPDVGLEDLPEDDALGMLIGGMFPGSIPMLEWTLKHADRIYYPYLYDNAFNWALMRRDSSLVTYCITHGDNLDIDNGLYYAAAGGDRGLVLLMLHLGGDPNEGLRGACNTTNISLANKMIALGADAWDRCLCECAEDIEFHIFDMAELMVSCGASDICGLLDAIDSDAAEDTKVQNWIICTMVRPCSNCGGTAGDHLYPKAKE